jgi:hypothetical protein
MLGTEYSHMQRPHRIKIPEPTQTRKTAHHQQRDVRENVRKMPRWMQSREDLKDVPVHHRRIANATVAQQRRNHGSEGRPSGGQLRSSSSWDDSPVNSLPVVSLNRCRSIFGPMLPAILLGESFSKTPARNLPVQINFGQTLATLTYDCLPPA